MTTRNFVRASVGTATLATLATASPTARMDVLLSTDNVTWTDQVRVTAGTLVHAAIYVSVTDAYGFAGATISSFNLRGLNAGDGVAFAPGTVTGRVAPFDFGAATNRIYTAADGFRIDAASDPDNTNTNAGMTFSQRDPATAVPAGTYMDGTAPRMAFAFDITVGQDHAVLDLVSLEFGPLVRGVCTVHTASDSTRGTTTSAVTVDGASIVVVPTPASLALLSLGGAILPRRRR